MRQNYLRIFLLVSSGEYALNLTQKVFDIRGFVNRLNLLLRFLFAFLASLDWFRTLLFFVLC